MMSEKVASSYQLHTVNKNDQNNRMTAIYSEKPPAPGEGIVAMDVGCCQLGMIVCECFWLIVVEELMKNFK